MPPATTSAIVAICPLSSDTSRKSFRSRTESHIASSPPQIARARALRDDALVLHPPVREGDDAVGHRRDGRVVRDDGGRGAELPVDPLDDVEHQDPGPEVERAG